MHARVITIQLQPEMIDEAIRIYQDAMPEVKQQQGVRELLLFVDRKTGKCISVALWDTEAVVQGTQTSGQFQRFLARGDDVMAEPPVVEYYELAAHELAEGAAGSV